MYGYVGKMLFVNLSDRSLEDRVLEEDLAKNFLGGPALGAKILYDNMPAHADVFGPDSMVGFIAAPLNNTGALFGGRYTVVSKSPVYGGWNDANSGGAFGPALKKAGYDAVFVNGIADTPVYIYIENGNAQIFDASDLWGLTVEATEAKLRERHGDKINAALIGPAGEKKSWIAAVMNDGHRAAGRGGTGAVVGSKNLKAIVVKGNLPTPVFDKDRVLALNKEVVECMKGPASGMANGVGTFGSAVMYVNSVLTGDAGVKNWTGSAIEDYPEEMANPVSGPGMDSFKTKKFHCANCPAGCGAFLNMPSDKWDLSHSPRPEYETLGAYGSLMLNNDPTSICRCNDLCNEYGTDTISTGSTVAWAMECYNEGIFSKEDLDGIELTWGNGDAAVALTEKIVKCEGIGAILAKGSREASRILGKGAECLVTASGIEEPQHDSRLAFGATRTYQYDPTPGRHVKGGLGLAPCGPDFDYSDTGERDKLGTSGAEIVNASGYCLFGSDMSPKGNPLKACSAVTGFEYTEEEGVKLGLRSFTMRHAFNLREGLSRKDFTLDKRYTDSNPPFGGPLADVHVDSEKLADNFFEAMHWDKETLIPTKESLEELGGLENVIRDIYG